MSSRVIVALDFASLHQAQSFVEKLDPAQCRLKVGSQMYTKFGPQWVKFLVGQGFDVFLDLKFLIFQRPLLLQLLAQPTWESGCSMCMLAAARKCWKQPVALWMPLEMSALC